MYRVGFFIVKTGGCCLFIVFRCEEHLYKRLRRSVRRSVPHDARLRGKLSLFSLVTSRLLREEEEEEETDYVAIPLCRDSITSRFLSHLGIRRSPCYNNFRFSLKPLESMTPLYNNKLNGIKIHQF
jgi:hypothetical protein